MDHGYSVINIDGLVSVHLGNWNENQLYRPYDFTRATGRLLRLGEKLLLQVKHQKRAVHSPWQPATMYVINVELSKKSIVSVMFPKICCR